MNPFYQAMGGKQQPNLMQQFQRFMNDMRGKNPHSMLQDLVSSGRISQQQLDHAQKQAQQIADMFQTMPGLHK